ncbi:hypothetical protein E2C01_023034 [Portunus trituberculatus]|uniref:Uncharacterized protein n=1 Tax=Portunus trituberculatus TaxID=210409 RepID=A0A5B7E967_PORTR|nr:hypothetical protein [Portunus trituberculatus]
MDIFPDRNATTALPTPNTAAPPAAVKTSTLLVDIFIPVEEAFKGTCTYRWLWGRWVRVTINSLTNVPFCIWFRDVPVLAYVM